MKETWVRNGHVVKIVDGDTIDVDVDLGFHINVLTRFRLARINAPEIRGKEREEGLKSKEFLIELLWEKDVIIKSEKYKGKWGRWIAEVEIDGQNVSDLLVQRGLAKYVDYSKRDKKKCKKKIPLK